MFLQPPLNDVNQSHAPVDPLSGICRCKIVLGTVELRIRGIDFILIATLASVIWKIQHRARRYECDVWRVV